MKKAILAVSLLVAFSFGSVFAADTMKPAMKPTAKKSMAMKKKSLYDRLGGKKAIVAVVDDFVGNVAADTRINKFFAKDVKDPKRLAKFKGNLVDLICMGSGGPCKYKGKSMKAAHMGMGIGDADFNALVEDLVKTLDKFKVPTQEKNELLAILGPMKKDIVEKKAGMMNHGGNKMTTTGGTKSSN